MNYKPLKPRRWHYCGDINVEYGGFFYCLDTFHWDYVEVVRITPCSDAGLAENCFWVERLTVNIPGPDQARRALECSGYAEHYAEHCEDREWMLVEACVSYGAYEQEQSLCVQVGSEQSGFGKPVKADAVLHGNTSLRKFALRVANRGGFDFFRFKERR